MEAVFLKVCNMGITASYIVLVVMMLRLLLRKSPKWMIVLMWGLVGIRLVCPFSLESVYSFIPSTEIISSNMMYMDAPAIHSGITALDSVVNSTIFKPLTPAIGNSVNPMQILTYVSGIIWIMGMIIMLVYMTISYLKIYHKVKEAIPLYENIWICDHVKTPFILGIINPRIYLPSEMNKQDMEYVIAHERAHLYRHDHWLKPLSFLLLTIYWFHPILWIAYHLFCKDMELACDEKVIRDMGIDNKKPYSNALINLSIPRRSIAACPLAFGEVGVKGRVKAVLHYKKPAFYMVVIAILSCVIAALCFLTDPATSVDERLAVLIDCEVASYHQSDESKENFCCLDWKVIGKEKRGNQTTVYMWVLYEEFTNDNGLTVESGAHTLTAITVEEIDNNYSLMEYWTPHDGSLYKDSIMEKIPLQLLNKALDPFRYIDEQEAKLEKLAKEHFAVTETDAIQDTSGGSHF